MSQQLQLISSEFQIGAAAPRDMKRDIKTPPPTIADVQSPGVAGAWVTGCNPLCLRSAPLSFVQWAGLNKADPDLRSGEVGSSILAIFLDGDSK